LSENVKKRILDIYSSFMDFFFSAGYGGQWDKVPQFEEAVKIDVDRKVAEQMALLGKKLKDKKFDIIFLGVPTTPTTAVAMGTTYVWSHFTHAFKSPKDHDDIEGFAKIAISASKTVLESNSDIEIINHYDPMHDRHLVCKVNAMRIKHHRLRTPVRNFIKEHLSNAGTVVFLSVTHPWPQFELAPNCYLQVGGGDGILPEEFLEGSVRIDEWLKELGSKHRGGWKLRGYPLITRTESESGTPPQLYEDVKEFSGSESYGLVKVEAPHFTYPGVLSAYITYRMNQIDGKGSNAFAVETYAASGLASTFIGRLVTLWLDFPTQQGYAHAKIFLDKLMQEMPNVPRKIIFAPFPAPCFTDKPQCKVPDRIPVEDWRKLFYGYIRKAEDLEIPGHPKNVKGYEIYNADESTYTFTYVDELRKIVERFEVKGPSSGFATLEDLEWACSRAGIAFKKEN